MELLDDKRCSDGVEESAASSLCTVFAPEQTWPLWWATWWSAGPSSTCPTPDTCTAHTLSCWRSAKHRHTHTLSHSHSNLQSLIGEVWAPCAAGVLPERQDAAEDVSGPGQDRAGWPRDDPPLRVSDTQQRAEREAAPLKRNRVSTASSKTCGLQLPTGLDAV